MIQEFTIKNMFSIKTRQTISFEMLSNNNDKKSQYVNIGGKKLLKILAVFGPNASGKSNLIYAFNNCIQFIMNGFTELKPKEETGFSPFLFDEDTKKTPGYFEMIFFINDKKYEYQLSLDANIIHKECLYFSPKGQKKLIFERLCNDNANNYGGQKYSYRWGDVFTGAKLKIAEMTRPNVTFFNTAAQLHQSLILEIYNWLLKTLPPVINPSQQNLLFWTMEQIEKNIDKKKNLLSFLEKAGFDHINDIVINQEEVSPSFLDRLSENEKAAFKDPDGKYVVKEIFLSHKYNSINELPIYEESRGTQRMLELAGPLLAILDEDVFFCIDEIESSLHEDLQEFLIKSFLEFSKCSQIIFTTHNQALMDSGLLLDDSIWFAEKGNDGGSTYFCLSSKPGIRKVASRRKLYKEGKLGALPNISKYESNIEE